MGVFCATLGGCSPSARAPEPRAKPKSEQALPPDANVAPVVISVLGLNDLHGRLSALPVFGGYVENVRKERKRLGDGDVLLVDAGDMFQGTLESNLTEGASVFLAYRALGMQAVALGNHEFDFGPVGDDATGDPQGALKARIREAPFPVLSANLVERASGALPRWPGLSASAIVTVAGVRIGVVGALTVETPSIVMPAYFAGLDVAPLAPALAREAKLLRDQGAELVVAITHAGADCSDFSDPHDLTKCTDKHEIFDAVAALPEATLDAVVAGHTHAGVAHYVGTVPIVEAYSRGKAFSRVDLALDRRSHRVSARLFPPVRLCPDLTTNECSADTNDEPYGRDAAVAAAIAPALALAAEKRAQLLGPSVSALLARSYDDESPLGNLFADFTLEAVPGADVAILNGGSLRADLPAGPLTYGALYEAMPFDNRLAKIAMTASDLLHVLGAHLEHDDHGIVSLAGLTLSARCEKGSLALELLRPNGRRVRPEETLTVATSDYLATGGDRLFSNVNLADGAIQRDLGETLRDAFARRMKLRHELAPHDFFDAKKPRLRLPSARPVRCHAAAP